MKRRFIIFFSLILILFFPAGEIFSQEQELSKEQIIQLAITALEKKEGKIQERVIIYDLGNGKWRQKFDTVNKEMTKKFDVLRDRNYQAVCFAIKPKPGLKGKNVWVFIDKFNGEVLALYVE